MIDLEDTAMRDAIEADLNHPDGMVAKAIGPTDMAAMARWQWIPRVSQTLAERACAVERPSVQDIGHAVVGWVGIVLLAVGAVALIAGVM